MLNQTNLVWTNAIPKRFPSVSSQTNSRREFVNRKRKKMNGKKAKTKRHMHILAKARKCWGKNRDIQEFLCCNIYFYLYI